MIDGKKKPQTRLSRGAFSLGSPLTALLQTLDQTLVSCRRLLDFARL